MCPSISEVLLYLIAVGVALDTVSQIESHLITRSYEGFLEKRQDKRQERIRFQNARMQNSECNVLNFGIDDYIEVSRRDRKYDSVMSYCCQNA